MNWNSLGCSINEKEECQNLILAIKVQVALSFWRVKQNLVLKTCLWVSSQIGLMNYLSTVDTCSLCINKFWQVSRKYEWRRTFSGHFWMHVTKTRKLRWLWQSSSLHLQLGTSGQNSPHMTRVSSFSIWYFPQCHGNLGHLSIKFTTHDSWKTKNWTSSDACIEALIL